MIKARIVRELTSLTNLLNKEDCELKLSEVYNKFKQITKHQEVVVLVEEKYQDFHGKYSDRNFIKIKIYNKIEKVDKIFVLGSEKLREYLLKLEVQEFLQNSIDWYKATRLSQDDSVNIKEQYLKLMNQTIPLVKF